MILFICPTCEEKFVLSADEIGSTAYLSCRKCNRIVPYHLIDSLKTVCRHFPKEEQRGRNNSNRWTIEISTDHTLQ